MSFDKNMTCGQMLDSKFVLPLRVYYEDTDAGGVVYNAYYLIFAERARTEFLRYLGFCNQQEILESICYHSCSTCSCDNTRCLAVHKKQSARHTRAD